jgi:hypothetical protein
MMDRARVTEVAPDHYSISMYVPEFNLRFNHFLIKDEGPLLFHTGMKQMFPLVRDAEGRQGPFANPYPYAIDGAHPAQTSRSSAETVGSYAWVHLCWRRQTGVARIGNRHTGSSGTWH